MKNKCLRKVSFHGADVTDVLLLAGCYQDASNKVEREYTADLRLLLYMESTTVFMPVISFYFVVFILNRSVALKRLEAAGVCYVFHMPKVFTGLNLHFCVCFLVHLVHCMCIL